MTLESQKGSHQILVASKFKPDVGLACFKQVEVRAQDFRAFRKRG